MVDEKQEVKITDEIINKFFYDFKNFLITKNKNYGDSALKPINIFNKLSASNSIAIRIDDKLSRIINSDILRENDCQDLFGYLILYCISEKYYIKSNSCERTYLDTEEYINMMFNVFQEYFSNQYYEFEKGVFSKLNDSEEVAVELDKCLYKLKNTKELGKSGIFEFMSLLVIIILKNNWVDMGKFID